MNLKRESPPRKMKNGGGGCFFLFIGFEILNINFGREGDYRPVGPKPDRITASTKATRRQGMLVALTTLPDQHNGTLNTVGVTARPAGDQQ